MKEKDLLGAFMLYLKDNDSDVVLQFCIDIGKFSLLDFLMLVCFRAAGKFWFSGNFTERISQSDIEAEELDCLYRDAWDLYSVYFSSHSPSCIKFKKDFASSMRKGNPSFMGIFLKNYTLILFLNSELLRGVLQKFCVVRLFFACGNTGAKIVCLNSIHISV